MRLVFLGTPGAAVPSLQALVESGHDVALVITRPDRKRGRGASLVASPVKQAALDLGLRVGYSLEDLDGLDVDRGVVVAYGALIPGEVLERTPMLNVHFSLLPRWRGAAPVERAILAGDERTGVCVMTLEESLDTGPVHASASVDVDDKYAAQLVAELAALGARLLVEVLGSPDLLEHPRPQVGEPTYAKKLTKATFRLEPSMTVSELSRTVRLGRAYCFVAQRRLRVLRGHALVGDASPGSVSISAGEIVLHAADGGYALDEVQPEGARPMSGPAWWAGARLDAGSAWS
ncbi:MAG: methionyl-tRNA formyltransferase [Acidimicrobiales bacterium]